MNQVLLVMPAEERSLLRQPFEGLSLEVIEAETCEAARASVKEHPSIQLVVTQIALVDGTWCNLLRDLLDAGIDAEVIVGAKQIRAWVWSQAIQCGGEYTLGPGRSSLRESLEAALERLLERNPAR